MAIPLLPLMDFDQYEIIRTYRSWSFSYMCRRHSSLVISSMSTFFISQIGALPDNFRFEAILIRNLLGFTGAVSIGRATGLMNVPGVKYQHVYPVDPETDYYCHEHTPAAYHPPVSLRSIRERGKSRYPYYVTSIPHLQGKNLLLQETRNTGLPLRYGE
jgi:hypothetical protein